MFQKTDIKENDLLAQYPEAFEILLKDRTTGGNIYWATDSYKSLGEGYGFYDEITKEKITGENGELLKPRASKSKDEQSHRTKEKAEVFTPSWICNKQNNLIDAAIFGGKSPFNDEVDLPDNIHIWNVIDEKIPFPTANGYTWEDYVKADRLEITCGEAPYLASRYDTTTGEFIEVPMRIGILDRKLRVVKENTPDESTKENYRRYRRWAIKALQSTYGFEWQGDNLFLARESLFCSFMEHYREKWNRYPQDTAAVKVAEIISWNIWQMDGLTCGLPGYKTLERIDDGFKFEDAVKPQERLCRIREWVKGVEPLQGPEIIFATLKNRK
ncbi:MAG: restriction endonuclease subunit M [Bacteroidaceae bacterium]|nr:restriction endonuclease subunit M [Bacteroidaceae bacterium]